MRPLTLGSLFDGIGGFPLAGSMLGIRPVWASEIEAAPISITRRRFTEMEHLGDITKINGSLIPPVDVITFGSPCQDLSVAGGRAGLEGKRSGLFMEGVRVIREMRCSTNGVYPAFAVWENVPGAYSSNRGEDFRAVVEELARAAEPGVSVPRPAGGRWEPAGAVMGDGWSLAWRTLDAQYWGVPQRRYRIFLVVDFRGGRAGEILFKRGGLPRDSSQGGTQGQSSAYGAAECFGETGVGYWQNGIQCLRAEGENRPSRPGNIAVIPVHDKATRYRGGGAGRNDDGSSNFLGVGAEGDPSHALDTSGRHAVAVGFNGWRGASGTLEYEPERAPCVQATMPPNVMAAGFMAGQGAKARSVAYEEETSPTLKSAPSGGNTVPSVLCVQNTAIGRTGQNGADGKGVSEDVSYTLDAREPHAVCAVYPETARALTARHDGGPCADRGPNLVAIGLDSEQNASVEKMGTLRAHASGGAEEHVATYAMRGYGDYEQGLAANTLRASHDVTTSTLAQRDYIVRRLTPRECERLQGFPDGWTALGHDGKPVSDSARYKAPGNSVAIPCVLYVLEGIALAAREGDDT